MQILEFPNPDSARGVPRIRIEHASFFADIVLDRRNQPDAYYVIVQQHGSASVLSLHRCESLDEARSSADRALSALATLAA